MQSQSGGQQQEEQLETAGTETRSRGTSTLVGGALGVHCTQGCSSGTATPVSQPWPQQSALVWAGLPFLALQNTLGPNQDTGTAEPCASPPRS